MTRTKNCWLLITKDCGQTFLVSEIKLWLYIMKVKYSGASPWLWCIPGRIWYCYVVPQVLPTCHSDVPVIFCSILMVPRSVLVKDALVINIWSDHTLLSSLLYFTLRVFVPSDSTCNRNQTVTRHTIRWQDNARH